AAVRAVNEFFLGMHHPNALATSTVPLFVSRTRLSRQKSLPRAAVRWALDSGGFTELERSGRWTLSARTYAGLVRRYQDEVGLMAWAAPQDWMVESRMLKRTGLSVDEHQRLTVENWLALRDLAPDLPIIPVLQGWDVDDYLRCIERYAAAD